MTDARLPLFVYGYLKRGGPGHHLLADTLETVKLATARGRRSDTGADYPGIIFASDGDEIEGELLYVRAEDWDEVIAQLDEYEGAPIRYTRIATTVSCEDNNVECYVYQWNDS